MNSAMDSASNLDRDLELVFSETLLKKIYAENQRAKKLDYRDSESFRRAILHDYVDLNYTNEQLIEDRDESLAAQMFFESMGQRLLAQRAGIRSKAAASLIRLDR